VELDRITDFIVVHGKKGMTLMSITALAATNKHRPIRFSLPFQPPQAARGVDEVGGSHDRFEEAVGVVQQAHAILLVLLLRVGGQDDGRVVVAREFIAETHQPVNPSRVVILRRDDLSDVVDDDQVRLVLPGPKLHGLPESAIVYVDNDVGFKKILAGDDTDTPAPYLVQRPRVGASPGTPPDRPPE
jgi:hypothetical protein